MDLVKIMNHAKFVVVVQCYHSELLSVVLLNNQVIVFDWYSIFSSKGSYVDIVDEALNLFRGDVFFANFEIHGPADRLLVVLILYISRVWIY